MPGVGNVKDVPLAGGRQVDLMATFARSPPVHQWTLSPSTSCLAYLPEEPVAVTTSFAADFRQNMPYNPYSVVGADVKPSVPGVKP